MLCAADRGQRGRLRSCQSVWTALVLESRWPMTSRGAPRAIMTPKSQDSWASSPAARRTMQANRGRDTKPERLIRSELHRRGLRYRVNQKVPGIPRRTIDISWPALEVAVFVDGCFWHGCPEHGTAPRSHSDFWAEKATKNRGRDRDTTEYLVRQGWLVLRFWEHEDPVGVADTIARAIADRRDDTQRATRRRR